MALTRRQALLAVAEAPAVEAEAEAEAEGAVAPGGAPAADAAANPSQRVPSGEPDLRALLDDVLAPLQRSLLDLNRRLGAVEAAASAPQAATAAAAAPPPPPAQPPPPPPPAAAALAGVELPGWLLACPIGLRPPLLQLLGLHGPWAQSPGNKPLAQLSSKQLDALLMLDPNTGQLTFSRGSRPVC